MEETDEVEKLSVETRQKAPVNPLWFYGNDPARDADYHTVVINGLFPRPSEGAWNPMLRDVYRFKGKDYLEVLDFLFKNLFKKYPPFKFVTDASRDPTFAELIIKKLGAKAEAFKFTLDSKLHLMTITKNYYKQGYALPDVDLLEREGRIDPQKAHLIREIKVESLREQIRPTGDKISFSDGGKHNDLLHGQALSLKGVYDYQKRAGFGATRNSLFGYGGTSQYDSRSSMQKTQDQVMKRFENAGMPTHKMKFNYK